MMTRKAVALLFVLVVVMLVPGVYAAESVKNKTADAVNINTAPAEMLSTLSGIGQTYAERIVAYRNAHGPFQRPEDIVKVDGIGPATWEKNKDVITIGPAPITH